MKIIIPALLILLSLKGFAQQHVYTFNNGILLNENEIKYVLESVKKSTPSSRVLVPVIYHKAIKNDTIVNYITFSNRKATGQETPDLKFEYKQDSLFLLLQKKLPAFKLKDLDGNEVSSDQLLGKPTLINFWATYCKPCIAEMPQLSRLKEKYKDKANFISITANSAAGDKLEAFLKDKDFNFRVLEDAAAYNLTLKIEGLPRNLFLDKDGVLRYIHGNYPIRNSTPMDIEDEENFFTKIIEELVREAS